MTLAERLSEFVAGLQFDDLPPDVVASVRLRALDILGIALASSTSELAPSVLGAVEGWGGGACSVVGSRLTAASPVAALANGALAHGLDFEAPAAHSVRRPVQPGLLGRRGAGGRPRRARHVHEGPDSRRAHPGAGRPCRAHRRSDRALPRWVPRLGPRSSPRRPARRGAGARWARGAARPLKPDAIVAKFRDNARRALPADRVAAIERAALSLDSLDDVGTLLAACRA